LYEKATMLITRRSLNSAVLAALSCAGTLAHSLTARAEVGGQVAVDLDLGAPLGTLGTERFLIGGGGRFGWRFDLGPVWLQPEAAGGYVRFIGETCPSCVANEHAIRALGGARIGGSGLVSRVIEPAIFGHAGYGWVRLRTYDLDGRAVEDDLKGPAFDVGVALDVRAVRWFRFGAHATYNVVVAHLDLGPKAQASWPDVKWIGFGLHAGAAF
jgi:hypothetical protein